MGSVPRFLAGVLPSPRRDASAQEMPCAHPDSARNGAVPTSVVAAPIPFAVAPEAQLRRRGLTHSGVSIHDDGENAASRGASAFLSTRHHLRRACKRIARDATLEKEKVP
jgi:hypothetical protein